MRAMGMLNLISLSLLLLKSIYWTYVGSFIDRTHWSRSAPRFESFWNELILAPKLQKHPSGHFLNLGALTLICGVSLTPQHAHTGSTKPLTTHPSTTNKYV